MRSMICYRKAAVEGAMKVQEVILRAMAKKITWWQAAEIIGISDRSMRRWKRSGSIYRTTQQSIALRLYQRILLPHREAGNAYWRKLVLE
jgi:hypothetical protein